jgi:hypothetical protein
LPTLHRGNLPIIIFLWSSIFPMRINPFVSSPVAQHWQRVHDARVPGRGGGARSREAVSAEDRKVEKKTKSPLCVFRSTSLSRWVDSSSAAVGSPGATSVAFLARSTPSSVRD